MGLCGAAVKDLAHIVAFLFVAGVASAQEDANALPFVGTDIVSILTESGQEKLLGGSIQGIKGDRLTLRTNGRGQIMVIRMEEVLNLNFERSPAWLDGLTQMDDGQLQEALVSFNGALQEERRDWAWCELQAAAARAETKRGNRSKTVERVERILERDPRSRHVNLLPLVWDSRLPDDERMIAAADELRSSTKTRRLVAASALLHIPEHRNTAISVLQRIRQNDKFTRIGQMAETQLWRLHLLEKPGERVPLLSVWEDRVRELPVEFRGGPQYIVARGYQQQHNYDRASLAFLWMPLMSPQDRNLAALSLSEAIDCLKKAGRLAEAEQMQSELKDRFPDASATKTFFAEPDR